MIRAWKFLFVLLIAAWAGYSLTTPARAYAADEQTVASLAPIPPEPLFVYEKAPVSVSDRLENELETKYYRVRSISFPSIGDNGQDGNLVTALYYQSKLPGKKKMVIILPIWGTHTYPPRKMTASLLSYSDGETNVLRILGKNFLFDWEAMMAVTTEEEALATTQRMVDRIRTHVIDFRRTLDWVEAQPDVDPTRIGLVAFSMGAVVGGLIMEHEPRIAASALVMGGANINEMLATCFGRAEELRKAVLPRLGWTEETFAQKLEAPLQPINPANYPGRVDPEHVIMFEAAYDTCIPKSGREALWIAMGKPERITWPYNHKMAFLTMSPLGLNTMRRRIYKFLEATL